MLTGFLTVLKLLWPFIKELFFGEKDPMVVIKRNWLTFTLFICVVLEFTMLSVGMRQLWSSNKQYRHLVEQQKTISLATSIALAQCHEIPTPPKPPAASAPQPAHVSPRPRKHPASDINHQLDSL